MPAPTTGNPPHAEVQVTQSDIDGIAGKLDQFATILTPKEIMIMLAALEFAGQAIKAAASAKPPDHSPTPTTTGLPRLSDGFRDAFKSGIGSTFGFEPSQTEDVGVQVGWTKKAQQ
jgi:hypothetical protein